MSYPVLSERRLTQRKRLTGLLPGRLTIPIKDKFVSCRPVDLSSQGLGIVTAELIAPGTELMLKTHNQEILLEVAWGQPDFGKQDLYRYGLVVKDVTIDLEVVFDETGCLK